jgi:hypothetical protein
MLVTADKGHVMFLIRRAPRGTTAGCVGTAVLFAALACGTSSPSAATGCQRGGTSFESGTLDGLTVTRGSARVQRGVRVEGCHALRLDPGSEVAREVSGSRTFDVAFAYRSQHPAARTLLTLADNVTRVADDGRGRVIVSRGGRRLARVARRRGRGGWAKARVKLANGRLSVSVDGRAARLNGVALGSERRFVFGGRPTRKAGALFLDALSIRAGGVAIPPASNGTGGAPPPANQSPWPGGAGEQAGPGGQGPTGWARPFAPDSFWNAPLPADVPLDPASNGLVAELRRQLNIGAPWINTTSYSTPVYRVPADQPTVRVTLDIPYQPLQKAWDAVPVPPDARAAGGTDKAMVIWQPATDTLWEFWLMERRDGSWHARWGGRMTDVSHSPGYYTGTERNWGASATSMPLLGGLITLDDVRSGHIDHALGMAIPEARKNWWTWPAQRTDGKKDDPGAIPEGARFRLDPRLDLDSLHLYPLVRMMAQAAQRYGIVVRDQAGVVAFAGEDPTPTGTNPWSGRDGWFSGQSPAALLQQFPWQHLEALRTEQQCCGSR